MTTVDRQRVLTAVHELGHAVVWHHAGIPIATVRVHGSGDSTSGVTRAKISTDTPHDARIFLLGVLAGREAEHRWCALTGQEPEEHGCVTDLRDYRAYRQRDNATNRWFTHISDQEFRGLARKEVITHWPQITQLAPTLARRGVITL